jgi:hypothetical protein
MIAMSRDVPDRRRGSRKDETRMATQSLWLQRMVSIAQSYNIDNVCCGLLLRNISLRTSE